MEYLYNYELFVEARLLDVANIIGTGVTFNQTNIDDKFLKFKTIRLNNKKIRFNINWNHTLQHDLIEKLKDRTSLLNISELNILLSKGIDEIYNDNIQELKGDGIYSLWFSEYNFSIIADFGKSSIEITTILPGQRTYNVKNIIELKSVL